MENPKAIPFTAAFLLALLLPPVAWAQDYTAGPVSDGGTISGTVIHSGGAVERSALVVNQDEEICGQTTKLSSELIVDPASHGIQNVVVSITDISHGKAWSIPDEGLTLDQEGCWFAPHVLVVPVGQSFDVFNGDGILHNLHTHGEENGGTIHGTVRFLGSVPAARTVEVTEDADACGETVQIQTLEVGSGQGLANTVVSLTDISQGVALGASASPRGIDQRGCRFTPHTQLAGIGQVVEIRNSDPVSHNIHTLAFDNRPINKMQPPALEKLEVTFSAPEKVKVKCDIHEWMSGWIIVIDHPYHDITGADGSFVLENVPPGTYTLEVWHEDLGSTTRTVTVTAGQSTEASFELGATSPQS